MAVVIRLRQQGKKNRRFFRLVVADERSPRDGKYIEELGWYDPHCSGENFLSIDEKKVKHWLGKGALISERAKALVRKKAPEIIKKRGVFKKKKKEK
jgi:small subunit ribosomal protein S16